MNILIIILIIVIVFGLIWFFWPQRVIPANNNFDIEQILSTRQKPLYSQNDINSIEYSKEQNIKQREIYCNLRNDTIDASSGSIVHHPKGCLIKPDNILPINDSEISEKYAPYY
jgi:hypothetical protein